MLIITCDREGCNNSIKMTADEIMGKCWIDCLFSKSLAVTFEEKEIKVIKTTEGRKMICKECYKKIKEIQNTEKQQMEANIIDKVTAMMQKQEAY